MFESTKADPRKHAEIRRQAAMWILVAIIWICVGTRAILRHKLDDIGWLIVGSWSFALIAWLFRLYRASERGVKD